MKEDRIFTTEHGSFVSTRWDGENRSGIKPYCDKVVVRVDAAATYTGRSGKILLPDNISERQTLSSTTGVIVAVGPIAFCWDSDRTVRWEGEKPAPGTRVCFQKYAGQEYTGIDGNMYRVMQDRSLAGEMEFQDDASTDAGPELFPSQVIEVTE